MMDGAKIVHMEPEAVISLRTEGHTHAGPAFIKSGASYRDITGLDDRIWQHLLDCAEQVRQAHITTAPETPVKDVPKAVPELTVRIRRCMGNTDAWLATRLRADGSESNDCASFFTDMSLERLVKRGKSFWPGATWDLVP